MEMMLKCCEDTTGLGHLCRCGSHRAWPSLPCVTGLSRRAAVSSCWSFAVAGSKGAVVGADSLEMTKFRLTILSLKSCPELWGFLL